jgi:hypothetical protein
MSLENITKAIGIDWTNTFIHWSPGVRYECDFDISPSDFLRFANQDFQNKDKRGIINAVTNAKRAIDCQVDTLLVCIGYGTNTKRLPSNVTDYIKRRSLSNESADVTQRLKLIRALEAAPSNLISKIRGIRNLLEHEYRLPTDAQANEAIELATLFVGSLSNVINTFLEGFDICNEEDMFQRDYRLWDNLLKVIFREGYFEIIGKANRLEVGRMRISKTENQYLELLRLNIAIGINGNVEDALYDLLKSINCDIPKNMVKVTLV